MIMNFSHSSGSCISYLAFNQTESFHSTVNKYINLKVPDRQQLRDIIPTGLFLLFFAL